MGEAMVSAIASKKLATASSVGVSDVSRERRQHLARQYGVTVTDDNRRVLAGKDVVVLAIKPKDLTGVMSELKGLVTEGQLVVSIIAGARLDILSRGLEHQAVVRAMPNTPARIGEGMTVWTATTQVTAPQRAQAAAVLGAMGAQVEVGDENMIDMATAVSGSGPAYLFFFVEAFIDAATHLGIPQDMAERLVRATVLGAGHLLDRSGQDPAELRRMVTSPGGTTAAAISRLEEGHFAGLLQAAVEAAYRRAKELAGG